jgi:hypothetical protein
VDYHIKRKPPEGGFLVLHHTGGGSHPGSASTPGAECPCCNCGCYFLHLSCPTDQARWEATSCDLNISSDLIMSFLVQEVKPIFQGYSSVFDLGVVRR